MAISLLAVATITAACSSDDGADATSTTTTEATPQIRLNEIQMVGSHNSYHLAPREEVAGALSAIVPDLYAEIDYTHRTLTEQLGTFGVRQFEIDVFADPDGGLYATPAALDLLDIDEEPAPEMLEPGFKVQHIQDIDDQSTCLTLVACLAEIEQWSSANPNHLPIMIMIETKTSTLEEGASSLGFGLPDLGVEFAVPPKMTAQLFEDLEAEVLSVFDREHLITPDDVRGDHDTLEAAVLDRGWPTVEESRGKVLISLVDTGPSADIYREGAPSLEGRLAFTSGTPGNPDAAFVRVDDPTTNAEDLARFAEAGYLIRTRTDSPGIHAVAGDTALRDSAMASGAHYLSTDYYAEDPELGTGYVVRLPGDAVARCNPVTAPPSCDDALLVED